MKIAWLENGDIIGGAELFSIDMLSALPQEDTVEILWSGNATGLQEKYRSLDHVSFSLFDFPTLKPFSFSTIKAFLQTVWNLQKKINEEKYDIIYANTVRTALILRFAKWFIPSSIRTVYFAHDYTFPNLFANFLLSGFSQILACSYGVKLFLTAKGIPSNHITVIENGVDIKKYESLPPVIHPIRKIGVIGRIAQWKGQLTVLHAAYDLKQSHHELPFRFHIFGVPSEKEEDQRYYTHLKYFVTENNLSSIVEFHGFVPIEKALAEVDIVVHAAEEPEPFGRVPLEGAAAKRIVCISNIGTPSQIFEHQKTALFFTPKNEKELADCLREAYLNAPLSTEIIQNAYTMVSEEFSLENIQKKFWDTIKN